MEPLFGRSARAALAVLMVVSYLAFAFPAIANLDVDGSILIAVLGAVAVVVVAFTLVRPTRPAR